ncbi:unnamed protein product [Paramecium octaurelia]|uniref:RNase III domain-containing protein n=1 Tax=Paramecium octaurelia TaxID=43137 RepID=A0A8S1WYM2_PAROT|nr:unnamed protein product [Paramecium octaurelia]
MQPNLKQYINTLQLLEFKHPQLKEKAMTFKQYHQEYISRNKDYPLKCGINENLIELGQDLIDFYYNDFFSYQEQVLKNLFYFTSLPNKTHKTFKAYSGIRKQKQLVLSEKNIADISVQLGLKDLMLVSINPDSELKNNPKIQSQALKALIGAQYFDKNKDLNLLRNLLQVLFIDLIQKSLDEAMNCHQQENIKGDFKEFMEKHQQYTYQLSFQEIKSSQDKQYIYEYELKINNVVPIKRSGKQKKIVEKEVFKVALQLLKSEQFQRLLDDSMKSQLDKTLDSSSYSISDLILDQNYQGEFHQESQILQLLYQQSDQIECKHQINEDERIKLILNY